jgi:DNA-binding transcriptional ArsR family regulator
MAGRFRLGSPRRSGPVVPRRPSSPPCPWPGPFAESAGPTAVAESAAPGLAACGLRVWPRPAVIGSVFVDTPEPDEQRAELTAAELRALAHPLRIRIIMYLGDSAEPATSAVLARALGESTGATSHHLRQLAKLGLIDEVPGYGTARARLARGVPRPEPGAGLGAEH